MFLFTLEYPLLHFAEKCPPLQLSSWSLMGAHSDLKNSFEKFWQIYLTKGVSSHPSISSAKFMLSCLFCNSWKRFFVVGVGQWCHVAPGHSSGWLCFSNVNTRKLHGKDGHQLQSQPWGQARPSLRLSLYLHQRHCGKRGRIQHQLQSWLYASFCQTSMLAILYKCRIINWTTSMHASISNGISGTVVSFFSPKLG